MRVTLIVVLIIAASVCFVSYAEKIQLCNGCSSISVGSYHEETCITVLNTVDSSNCFVLHGRKGFVNFESYNFLQENGSYVWYIYSDTACTPNQALLMGRPCPQGSCCDNGGFYFQNNNTDVFNGIRVGLPPPNPGNDDDGLESWQIALIVVGSVVMAIAIVGIVLFIIKRNRANSYQSV